MPWEPTRRHGHKLGIMASADILSPWRRVVVLSDMGAECAPRQES